MLTKSHKFILPKAKSTWFTIIMPNVMLNKILKFIENN